MRTAGFVAAFAVLGRAAGQGSPNNGNVALVNDPTGCASDLSGAVAAITEASDHIVQGVAVCPPKTEGKDSACAAAITLSVTQFSLASEKLSSASRTCANTIATDKAGKCAEDISDTIKQFGVSSAMLIASTESCKAPSDGGSAFGCVVDVVDVVDALANSAQGINDAVISCGNAKKQDPRMVYLYQTWLATGCPSLPTPDWINWGYWYADSKDKSSAVLRSMYNWCIDSKDGKNPEASNYCCAGSSCPAANCGVLSAFAGTYVAPATSPGLAVRSDSQLQESLPLTLE